MTYEEYLELYHAADHIHKSLKGYRLPSKPISKWLWDGSPIQEAEILYLRDIIRGLGL